MLAPLRIDGQLVSLHPLAHSHVYALAVAGLDPDLWRYQPRRVSTLADMGDYVDRALNEQSLGLGLPFVIVHRSTGAIVGSTRLMELALAHRRVEIGATWITSSLQRSGANVEAKLLLMAHAFETLGVQKVVLKTETLNQRSRRAILALGAVEEGTFRQHLIADDGRSRDMVFYRVLSSDWPSVKHRLQTRLDAHRGSDVGPQ